MNKKKEGDVEMVVLTQKEIKNRVTRNSSRYKKTIEQITSDIRSQGLKKGRRRPKDPTEAFILNNFEK
jgi:hypothetical protein